MTRRSFFKGTWQGSLIAVAVVAVLTSAMVAAKLSGGRASSDEAYSLDDVPFEVASSYQFIASHAEHASRIPCYCGCVSLDHRHLLDCFVKPDGRWEEHATGCEVCRDEAVDMRDLLAEGLGIEEIRERIDETYGSMGMPTKTP